jgi:glycerate kinase
LGFALLAFLRADFQPGAALAIELSGLRRHLRGADLCFTGEGQTDAQTACGKLPAAVARVCRGAGVPCVCLSGALGTGWRHTYRRGFTGIFSIAQRPQSPEAAIRDTARSLADAAEAVARIAAASRRP